MKIKSLEIQCSALRHVWDMLCHKACVHGEHRNIPRFKKGLAHQRKLGQ